MEWILVHWPTMAAVLAIVLLWVWFFARLSWLALLLSYAVWIYLLVFIWQPGLVWWKLAGIWTGVFLLYGLSMAYVGVQIEEEVERLQREREAEKAFWFILKILTFPFKTVGWMIRIGIGVLESISDYSYETAMQYLEELKARTLSLALGSLGLSSVSFVVHLILG